MRRLFGPIASGSHIISALAVFLTMALSTAPVQARTKSDAYKSRTLVGSYLAGRFARSRNDISQAVIFYRSALSRDPDNKVLLEQSFLMEASSANWNRAIRLARRLILVRPTHQMAHTMLGLADFKARKYSSAARHFKAADANPVGELTSTIARAWVALAKGDTKNAVYLLRQHAQTEWAQYYIRYHRALIADQAGRRKLAQREYQNVFEKDTRTLRTALAYARHCANMGNFDRAKAVLEQHIADTQSEPHPLVSDLQSRVKKKKRTTLLVATPDEGMAEVFYGLGEALSGEGGINLGIIYLQMALYLEPRHAFALAALANAYESTKRYQDAINAYNRIPKNTPLRSAIAIRNAFNLNSLNRVKEAQAILDDLARRNPTDIRPLDALGNIMRARKRYKEAIDYYTRAIALIKRPQKRHWAYYYARGTCYERIKRWPEAEADLKRALELYPDQPAALNYLGYSWIDQNRHLREGMSLIEKAVALKPDDGYIVDSLGWAHYKLGNFEQATIHLERAVELRPYDPVLNDHLGDAFWRVGREREARFQWDQALTLSPEADVEKQIKQKMKDGLPPRREARAGSEQTTPPNLTSDKTKTVRSSDTVKGVPVHKGGDSE